MANNKSKTKQRKFPLELFSKQQKRAITCYSTADNKSESTQPSSDAIKKEFQPSANFSDPRLASVNVKITDVLVLNKEEILKGKYTLLEDTGLVTHLWDLPSEEIAAKLQSYINGKIRLKDYGTFFCEQIPIESTNPKRAKEFQYRLTPLENTQLNEKVTNELTLSKNLTKQLQIKNNPTNPMGLPRLNKEEVSTVVENYLSDTDTVTSRWSREEAYVFLSNTTEIQRKLLFKKCQAKSKFNPKLNAFDLLIADFLPEHDKINIMFESSKQEPTRDNSNPIGDVLCVTLFFNIADDVIELPSINKEDSRNSSLSFYLRVIEGSNSFDPTELTREILYLFYEKGISNFQPSNVKCNAIRIKTVYSKNGNTFNTVDFVSLFGKLDEKKHYPYNLSFNFGLTTNDIRVTRNQGFIKIPFVTDRLKRFNTFAKNSLFIKIKTYADLLKNVITLKSKHKLALVMETNKTNTLERFIFPYKVSPIGFQAYGVKNKPLVENPELTTMISKVNPNHEPIGELFNLEDRDDVLTSFENDLEDSDII